jgi:hypothetical protein
VAATVSVSRVGARVGFVAPGELREAVGLLVAGLTGRADELVERVLRGLFDQFRDVEFEWEPAFVGGLRESVATLVAAGVGAAATGSDWGALWPEEPVRRARWAARSGVPLELLLRAYRIGHREVWECVAEECARLELTGEVRLELLKQSSRVQFGFVDHVMDVITGEYTRELQGATRVREQRRLHAVAQVLGGRDDAGEDLGYRLGQAHLALIAEGEGAEACLAALLRGVDAERLVVSDGPRRARAWLGRAQGFRERESTDLGSIGLDPGLVVSCGSEGAETEGFRLSYRQAEMALLVARRRPGVLVRYRDVAHLAPLLADPSAARGFVDTILGPLEIGTDRGGSLADTLRAYFASQHQLTATAAALRIHPKTVSYRLRRIEERLGSTILTQHAQIEIALELAALLDSTPVDWAPNLSEKTIPAPTVA